jgi:hypothetical protein
MKYFYGVYRDYNDNSKIAQLCETVDSLSCEILADPGCVTMHESTKKKVIEKATALAKEHGCIKLEVNFDKYKIVKIK